MTGVQTCALPILGSVLIFTGIVLNNIGANKRFENIISSLKAHLAKDQKIIVLIKKGNISEYFISDKIEVHELPEFPFLDRFITFILYSIKLMSFERMIVVSDFMPIALLALSKHIHFQLIHDIRNFTEFRRVEN